MPIIPHGGQISTPPGKTPARVLERRKVGNDDELTVAVEDSFLDDKGINLSNESN